MKVVIAEKPSVAQGIAQILGATKREDGYLSGNGYCVTWAFGHLIGLAMPEQYGITGFERENLPILPEEFKLIPRQVRDGKEYKADPGTMKQLKIIKGLFNTSEEIIVATDAGREGELIFRYIYNYIGCNVRFRRLWISSLTDRSIREGFDNLKPGNDYDKLYLSAKCRSEADWLVGINSSQSLSVAAGRGIYSLGRVQTPTLAMICQRYQDNKSFKPEKYWQIKVDTEKDDKNFSASCPEKFLSPDRAAEIVNKVRSSGSLLVKKVERKEVSENPPLLYDLTTLQKDANIHLNFSADKTLSIAQSLYEAKLISYPRTGSRYISDDVFTEIPERINNLKKYNRFSTYASNLNSKALNNRPVDNNKITDHHALITTENLPEQEKLSPDERAIYELIAGRLLEAFSPKCIKDVTSVLLEAFLTFSCSGSIIKQAGWRDVFKAEEKGENEDTVFSLPELSEGDMLYIKKALSVEKETKPKPLHTEASLLAMMENAGKELTNEELKESMKDCGIGTPATRASIIETLFSREYIKREKKSLVPTEKGLTVYRTVSGKKIADITMTAEWENALDKISTGVMNPDIFMKSIKIYTEQVTKELLNAEVKVIAPVCSTYKCPKCGKNSVIIYDKVAKCSTENCLLLFRQIAGKKLSEPTIKELLTKGCTGLIKGFKSSKTGKDFSTALKLNAEFNIEFDYKK